jgi:toxin ParE1/3/4
MSFTLRISATARRDIEDVLAYTLAQFGERKRAEYRLLIQLALADIRADPNKTPAKRRPELHRDARTFHIARAGRRARHFLLFRVVDGEIVEIGRLLHDAMELRRHLPEGFEAGEE